MLKAAGANPVGPLLVFLDLLKRDAKILTEPLLAHPQHHAAKANPTSDVYVYWIWLFLVGHLALGICRRQ
jgi:hypothetical protein